MKRLTTNQLEKNSGGAKCIYHAIGAMFGFNPMGFVINYFSGNYRSVYECWNNNH
jgi:hypothetical protein